MRVRRTRLLSALTGAVAVMAMLAQPAMADPDIDPTARKTGTLVADNMTGGQVVPGPGDPDGFGSGRIPIDSDAGVICWDVDTENLELPLTGSLIHVGEEGQVGEVVYRLFSDTDEEDPSGCREEDGDLIRELLKNSQDYYFEIYDAGIDQSSDDGAIRDQLELEK